VKIAREVVRYTVLSHRWSDEEVSFTDVQTGILPDKAPTSGRKKLEDFLDHSRNEYGIELGWADTCCIDKTNSSELDESIRSMFRWYEKSSVCLVHLGETHTFEDLEHDVWFTRGWTLQELLAPKRIRFYNTDWVPCSLLVLVASALLLS